MSVSEKKTFFSFSLSILVARPVLNFKRFPRSTYTSNRSRRYRHRNGCTCTCMPFVSKADYSETEPFRLPYFSPKIRLYWKINILVNGERRTPIHDAFPLSYFWTVLCVRAVYWMSGRMAIESFVCSKTIYEGIQYIFYITWSAVVYYISCSLLSIPILQIDSRDSSSPITTKQKWAQARITRICIPGHRHRFPVFLQHITLREGQWCWHERWRNIWFQRVYI